MKDCEVLEVCKRINKYFDDNRLCVHVYPYGMDMPVVVAEVRWGDWKHEHLRLKLLMEKIGAPLIKTDVTEEDGSDTYCADHYFMVDEDVLKGVA